MSLTDTLTPFISAPWVDALGRPLPVRPLPGLRSRLANQPRPCASARTALEYREFLGGCRGLAGTALGLIDFAGTSYPQEPCPVFHPCLTLAVDSAGRRWIAEMSDGGSPGRVWCLFGVPQVAVHVSEDLVRFLATLKERTCQHHLFSWLQDLTAQAKAIWAHRRRLAIRPAQATEVDSDYGHWLAMLPPDAYVYDLRAPMAARGWPYGAVGRLGRLYRYEREPVFAVIVPGAEGPQLHDPAHLLRPRVGPRADGRAVLLPPPRVGRAAHALRRQWTAGEQACA